MCLEAKRPSKGRFAFRTRTFYKILHHYGDVWYTPFREEQVKLGELYIQETSDFRWWKGWCGAGRNWAEWWELHGGAYHLFERKKDAEDFLLKQCKAHDWNLDDYKVVKAIVPRSSSYVKGFFSGRFHFYANSESYSYRAIGAKSVMYVLLNQ